MDADWEGGAPGIQEEWKTRFADTPKGRVRLCNTGKQEHTKGAWMVMVVIAWGNKAKGDMSFGGGQHGQGVQYGQEGPWPRADMAKGA